MLSVVLTVIIIVELFIDCIVHFGAPIITRYTIISVNNITGKLFRKWSKFVIILPIYVQK